MTDSKHSQVYNLLNIQLFTGHGHQTACLARSRPQLVYIHTHTMYTWIYTQITQHTFRITIFKITYFSLYVTYQFHFAFLRASTPKVRQNQIWLFDPFLIKIVEYSQTVTVELLATLGRANTLFKTLHLQASIYHYLVHILF